MKGAENDKWLDDVLFEILGSERTKGKFDEWQGSHPEAVELLRSHAERRTSAAEGPLGIRSRIMKSRITKLAAAAVIITALFAGIHWFGGSIDMASVTWAAVSERILNAETAIFDVRVGEEGRNVPTVRCIQGKQRMRQKLPEGIDMVLDYEEGKVLILDSNRKTAMFIRIDGLPEAPPNFFERLKFGIEKLKGLPDATVESVGRTVIDDRDCVGLRVYVGQSADVTIWSEVEGNLPVLVIADRLYGETRAVFSNFDFDTEIDESLFSMEVPDGYTLQDQAQADFANPTEQDLVEGLRIWADLIGGLFPPKLSLGVIQEQSGVIEQRFKENRVPDAEQVKMMVQIVRGLTFVQKIKGGWEYAGEGVQLGEGEKAIFWYQPEDGDNYHVIYGDLRVEELPPENMAK